MKNLLKLVLPAGILFVVCWFSPSRVAAFPETCGSIPQCPLTGTCTAGTTKVCCIVEIGLRSCTCSGGHYSCAL
jgi:hypothetical protein